MASEALALLPPGSRGHLRGTLQVIRSGTRNAISDFAAAESSFDRIVADARRSQNLTLLVGTLNHRGQTSVTRGRLDEARPIFEDAVRSGQGVSAEASWLLCAPHTSLAEIFLENDDLAGARDHIVRAV